MFANISLVLPYYNESHNIELTFNLILSQNLMPRQIIFINSNSSDDSFKKLNRLIDKCEDKQIKFLNIDTKIATPSAAKNFGISKSIYDIIAFMDFELIFDNRWIESQFQILSDNEIDIVFGVAHLSGKSNFDKACCFQTFGYMSGIPIVPSSMMYKRIFKKVGTFIEIRSVYDKLWIQSIFNKKVKHLINKDVSIDYTNYSFAKNPKFLILKILNTCLQSAFIKGYHSPYFYLASTFPLIILPKLNTLFCYFFFFLIMRGFYLPYKKNKKYYWQNKHLILHFIYTGFIIDLTKYIGFTVAFLLGIFKIKIRLDKFYNN
jgi:glycosyltransferase involved in cell wall biosynthesis